jgi:deoxyribodipyrimidine photo-lyase
MRHMWHVVWFKRDLRLADQPAWAAAVAACRAGGAGHALLPLWVWEPDQWRQPDVSAQQQAFVRETLASLADALRPWHLQQSIGAMPDVLAALQRQAPAMTLYSCQETGNAWSYQRDLTVGRWCRAHGVAWHEYPHTAVVRRLLSHSGGRDAWSAHWARRMSPPPQGAPALHGLVPAVVAQVSLAPMPQAAGADKPGRECGGRPKALARLASFTHERAATYRADMASPLAGASACSRLSAHLAWGSVSVRECVHATWDALAHWRQQRDVCPQAPGMLAGLKSFESRLHWHCHFMQKLETEPALEWRNLHRAYDDVRNQGPLDATEAALLQAWAQGRTGWPMVDACMRFLAATGWLNFRMRAMLMSVATGPLWLHWQAPGLHLAREFTDYEPGIHWSQCQMQSGTTGINTVRLYNPIKQGMDQDPQGVFIRRWVPELADWPAALVHEPWLDPARCHACNYPMPVVDLKAALARARERLWAVRQDAPARAESQRVYQRHGSRHPRREGHAKRPGAAAEANQLSLDW